MGNIIVDGGVASTGKTIRKIIETCDNNDQSVDAIIATHVDEDHIAGLISGLNAMDKDILQKRIDRIMFNTKEGFLKNVGAISSLGGCLKNDEAYTNTEDFVQVNVGDGDGCSIGDAKSLRRVITEKGLDNRLIDFVISGSRYVVKGANISIISPDNKALSRFMNEWESQKEHLVGQGCVEEVIGWPFMQK